MLAREAVAVHDEGGTQRDGDADAGPAKSDAYYYYNIRNRLLYAALHREDIENDFRERFFNRITRNCNADYVFQSMDGFLTDEQIKRAVNRKKP